MDAIERREHCVRFGKELRRIRREAGISMETLGNRAGLHRTEVGHLEHASREPRLTTIMRVAHALDISASRLLESFWGRMQVELLNRRRWKTRVELANAIFEYIESFHNNRRRHSSLNMLTPTEFEQVHQKKSS